MPSKPCRRAQRVSLCAVPLLMLAACQTKEPAPSESLASQIHQQRDPGHLATVASSDIAIASAPTRTPWTMHDGLEVTPGNPLGLVQLTCSPARHGDVCEYDDATVPPSTDPGWGPAPNGEIIGLDFFCGQSRVCSAPITCLAYADFTYFQTFVDIPVDVVVTEFTITFRGMDDGSRVSIFNSDWPGGLVVPGSFVFLGGSGTTDLSPYVVSGEVNRVVVTQVDDCCCDNNLHEARVVLNGEVVDPGCSDDSQCDDGNACTDDVCNEDGSCSNPVASCDDGNACTTDTCDPAAGCSNEPITCDDNSVCTTDTCDPAAGCQYEPISCDDGDGCTVDTCDAVDGCSNENQCPDCSEAGPSEAEIWPPNHKMVSVGVAGVSDPQGQDTVVTIDAIAQDEPTDTIGDGRTCPDGDGLGTSSASVRAERTGSPRVPGDGRVYHISFTATDPDGYQCQGQVATCVPHDQSGSGCVDQGPLYDSLVCE